MILSPLHDVDYIKYTIVTCNLLNYRRPSQELTLFLLVIGLPKTKSNSILQICLILMLTIKLISTYYSVFFARPKNSRPSVRQFITLRNTSLTCRSNGSSSVFNASQTTVNSFTANSTSVFNSSDGGH